MTSEYSSNFYTHKTCRRRYILSNYRPSHQVPTGLLTDCMVSGILRSDGHVLKIRTLSSNLGQIRRKLREALSRDCVGSGRSAKYHSESPCDEEQVCQRSFPPKSSPKAVMAGRSQDSSSQPLFCTLVRGRRTSVGTRLTCADKR